MSLWPCVRIVLTCGIVLAGPGHLDARPRTAEALLQEGLIRYNVGQFERSIRILKRAGKKARDGRVRAKIQLYLGLNYAVTGASKKAGAAFTKALTLDPALDLKPSETKDSILDIFRQARRQLEGQLVVRADRDGVLVIIDGKERGKTPFSIKLAVGKHRVRVTTPDREYGFMQDVLVHAGKSLTLDARLQLVGGKLDLITRPGGAKVMIGSKERGKTPIQGLVLAAGRHEISLTLEGHLPQTRTVSVKADRRTRMNVEMVPLSSGAPPGAERHRLWTWIAAGSSVAAAGVGLGLGIWANSGWEQYQEAAANGDSSYNDLREDVPDRCIATNVLFATAGALAIAAVVLFILEDRPAEKIPTEKGHR